MLAGILNLPLIAKVFGILQVTPLKLDFTIFYIIYLLYLTKSKLHRFSFCVTASA